MQPEFIDYRVTSLNINNQQTPKGEQTMRLSYTFAILEIEDHKYISKCNANLHVSSSETEDEPAPFFIAIEMQGIFKYDEPVDDLDELSKACAKEMVPFIRAHIASAAASIGVPSIIVPSKLMLETMK